MAPLSSNRVHHVDVWFDSNVSSMTFSNCFFQRLTELGPKCQDH